jgi:inosine/xanthosine triphosphate pyrophosphatase family protein
MTRILVAATRNPAKLEELLRLVADIATVEPLPPQVRLPLEIETAVEDGDAVAEIAAAKAAAWSRQLPGKLVIASDGGLTMPALSEWRPTRTRRFAGDTATDEERATRLLELASNLRGDERRIGWSESLAIALGGDVRFMEVAESIAGVLASQVDREATGKSRGFWLPTLWECPEFGGRLLYRLTEAERAARDDHWARLRGPVRAWLAAYGAATTQS